MQRPIFLTNNISIIYTNISILKIKAEGTVVENNSLLKTIDDTIIPYKQTLLGHNPSKIPQHLGTVSVLLFMATVVEVLGIADGVVLKRQRF